MTKASVLFIALAVLFLSSCSERVKNTDYKFSTGYLINEEDISSRTAETTEKTPLAIDEATVYYWTASGSKLHLFLNCQSLSKSDPEKIKEGTIDVAYSDNKTEPCSFCLKNANLEKEDFPVFVPPDSTGSVPKETLTPEEITYIWTKNGTKLHIFESCRYLSRTSDENKIYGNKDAALEYGISEICSSCQKNTENTD